jgi:hypothetical protein
VKAVPGRKTDVNDATWLADLLVKALLCWKSGAGTTCVSA